jgi:hypothetical protein
MRTFLAHSIRARGFGLRKAGYKTAADTSLRHHMKINLANRAVFDRVCENVLIAYS